jgi:hypothetical protein
LVRILVAIGTERELNFKQRCVTGWKVTLRAVYGGMLVAQGKACPGMIRSEKPGGPPSIDGVAAFALSAVGPLRELSAVRIWLMTAGAGVMRYRTLEISAFMAGIARYWQVFPGQRELGFRVIEFLDESRAFPTTGVMATLASLLELTLMDVFMACGTAVETQANILGSSIGLGKMTALAFHLDVSAR